MRTSCVKNGLVVVVILLFIGVAVQPSIATVQPESIDTEYFDVTTEFIGLGKEFTVQSTQQQMDELDAFFESIRERLNNTEIKEETIQIFNDAIVELDRLGLLGGYNLEQVQKLVTGKFQKPRFNRLMDKLYDRIPVDNNTNTFCQIAGRTTSTWFIPLGSMIANKLLSPIALLLGYFFPPIFLLFEIMGTRFILSTILIPFTFGSGISIGYKGNNLDGDYFYKPAKGWIHTDGISGQKKWEGSFYGQISIFWVLLLFLYIGVLGYKGIKISVDLDSAECYYLGFANYVNIGLDPPD